MFGSKIILDKFYCILSKDLFTKIQQAALGCLLFVIGERSNKINANEFNFGVIQIVNLQSTRI